MLFILTSQSGSKTGGSSGASSDNRSSEYNKTRRYTSYNIILGGNVTLHYRVSGVVFAGHKTGSLFGGSGPYIVYP